MEFPSETVQAKRLAGLLLPWIVVFTMLFLRLGGVPLMAPDEGRNAEVAREMYESGAWLVPTYNGLDYLDKPAFFFKAVAVSYALMGVSEMTARLPSALFGLGLLAVVFHFARRVYDRPTAVIAVMVLATTPLYMAFSRIVIFDMTLAFFVCSAVFAGFLAETGKESERKRWYLLAATFGSLATLVKGPVGFIIPLLVLVIFNWLDGRRGAVGRIFAPAHWLIFLAIVSPWFFGLTWHHPDFPYYGIIKESLSRFGTAEFKRTQPFYYYAVIIATCVFPWSTLLPEAAIRAWKSRHRWSSADRLLIVWSVVVVLFFSISQSKLPGYILSGVVASGILIARVFAQAFHDRGGAKQLILRSTAATGLICAGLAAFLLGYASEGPGSLANWLKIPQAQWAGYSTILQHLGLSMAAVALLAFWARAVRSQRLALAAFLLLPLTLVTVNFESMAHYADNRSSRALAKQIPDLPKDAELACLGCFPNGLPFYLQRFITVITDDAREFTSNYIIFSLHSQNLHSPRIVPQKDRDRWLTERARTIYLMGESDSLAELRTIAQRYGADVVRLNDRFWGTLLWSPLAQAGH